jgi:hypothetical protein
MSSCLALTQASNARQRAMSVAQSIFLSQRMGCVLQATSTASCKPRCCCSVQSPGGLKRGSDDRASLEATKTARAVSRPRGPPLDDTTPHLPVGEAPIIVSDGRSGTSDGARVSIGAQCSTGDPRPTLPTPRIRAGCHLPQRAPLQAGTRGLTTRGNGRYASRSPASVGRMRPR